jgi:hypothetical protein
MYYGLDLKIGFFNFHLVRFEDCLWKVNAFNVRFILLDKNDGNDTL